MKKLLLSLAAMIIGTGSLFAEQKVVTITGEDNLWTQEVGPQTGTKEGVTIAVTEGRGWTDTTGKKPGEYRSYAGHTFTVSVAEGAITKIEVACTANGAAKYGPGNFTAAVGEYTSETEGKNGTWTGNAASVELSSAKAQVRMNTITVTYEVGGTVTPAPDPVSLALTEGAAVKTEYMVGETFNPEGLVATVTMSDKTTKDVTNEVAWSFEPAVVAADTKSVTATASYKNLTASKTFNITIKEAPKGEQVVTITGEDNLWTTTAGAQTGTKGDITIATGEGVMGTFNNLGHYRVYKNQTLTVTAATGKITSIEFVCTAKGAEKYGPGNFTVVAPGTYAFDETGNTGKWEGESEKVELTAVKAQVRIESIKVTYVVDAAAPEATALELTEVRPVDTVCYVGDKFSVENLKATATFADKTQKDVTDLVAWTFEPAVIAEDTKTVTVTAAYQGVTASKTYDVTVKSIANTMETAYTVEEAVALIDAGKGLSATVFVKGIISSVESFNEKYGSITYNISTDGTTSSQQFQCYSGLNIGGEKFTSEADLTVGTKVVVKGNLKKHNEIYEFNYNNEIVGSETVGVDNITIEATQKDGKVVENGKVVILKAGKKFLVNGQRIK